MIQRIIAKIKRTYRRMTRKPYLDNDRFPGYWFRTVFAGRPASVVQIGSNDGKTGDPLYELLHANPEWKALLVEPLPDFCERLRANYPDTSRFQVANVAINEGRTMPFYFVDATAKDDLPDLPFWFDQLGSFDRAHIVNQLDGVLEPYIRSIDVDGVRLMDLLRDHQIKDIDIFHVDAEGYDWKILSQLDLDLFQPTFILFEANHMSTAERRSVIDFLEESYELFAPGIDGFAVRKTLDPALLRRLRARMASFASPSTDR